MGLAKIRGDATLSVQQSARHPTGRSSGRPPMKSILRASLVCVVFAGLAVALTGERMAPIALDKMSPAQRKVAEVIMAGPRGGLRGPFNAWLGPPEPADRVAEGG